MSLRHAFVWCILDEGEVQRIKSLYVFPAQVLQDLQPSVVGVAGGGGIGSRGRCGWGRRD
jgi:hypothetical protein